MREPKTLEKEIMKGRKKEKENRKRKRYGISPIRSFTTRKTH